MYYILYGRVLGVIFRIQPVLGTRHIIILLPGQYPVHGVILLLHIFTRPISGYSVNVDYLFAYVPINTVHILWLGTRYDIQDTARIRYSVLYKICTRFSFCNAIARAVLSTRFVFTQLLDQYLVPDLYVHYFIRPIFCSRLVKKFLPGTFLVQSRQ